MRKQGYLRPVHADDSPDPSQQFQIIPDTPAPPTGNTDLQTYRTDDFLFPASDDKGHSTRFDTRVPEEVKHQATVIVASQKFPYKTTGELLRHALIRHLHWLAQLEPTIPSYLRQIDAINEIARQQQKSLQFEDSIRNVMTTLAQLRMRPDSEGQLRMVVAKVLTEIDKMDDEPYWQTNFRRELLANYGYLLQPKFEDVIVPSPGDAPTAIYGDMIFASIPE